MSRAKERLAVSSISRWHLRVRNMGTISSDMGLSSSTEYLLRVTTELRIAIAPIRKLRRELIGT